MLFLCFCYNHLTWYRFKIHVQVQDKTAVTTLVLFNVVAERLLDTSAKKLLNKLSSSRDNIPPEIHALVGKDYVYKLRLNKYNLRYGFEDFTVSEIFVPVETLETAYAVKITPEVNLFSMSSIPLPIYRMCFVLVNYLEYCVSCMW